MKFFLPQAREETILHVCGLNPQVLLETALPGTLLTLSGEIRCDWGFIIRTRVLSDVTSKVPACVWVVVFIT